MYPLLFVASRGASSSQALQVLSFKKGGSQVLRCLQGVSTSTDICSNKYQESDQGCHAELQGHVLVNHTLNQHQGPAQPSIHSDYRSNHSDEQLWHEKRHMAGPCSTAVALSTSLCKDARASARSPLCASIARHFHGQQLQQWRHWHKTSQLPQQLQAKSSPGSLVGSRQHQETPSPSSPSLLMRMLPPRAQPFAQLMRLDKPIGTWLLLWPSLWSIAMAAQPGCWPDLWTTILFSLGAVLLRGSGCTINDLWDRELDRQVARTRSRPLASGEVTPAQAVGLLAAQLSLGLIILLQLNDYSKILGASSLILVGLYPLMKRITFWPQAFLGLTINWGAMLGWAAVRGECDWSVVLPLYLSGTCWSLVYDTIYAHQDKHDDAVAGMGSTALLFGSKTDLVLLGFATAQVALLALAGGNAGLSWPYYVGVTGLASHLVWQIRTVDLNNGKDCMDTFISNKWAGGILFAGCLGGRLLST